jgi:TM2 domain-containing membrane protein YozV
MDSYIDRVTKNMTYEQSVRFRFLYQKLRKKKRIAYLLWLIGGIFGLHRFYLRDYSLGFIILAFTILTFGIGGIIGFIDVINIKRLTDEVNKDIILQIVKEVKRI